MAQYQAEVVWDKITTALASYGDDVGNDHDGSDSSFVWQREEFVQAVMEFQNRNWDLNKVVDHFRSKGQLEKLTSFTALISTDEERQELMKCGMSWETLLKCYTLWSRPQEEQKDDGVEKDTDSLLREVVLNQRRQLDQMQQQLDAMQHQRPERKRQTLKFDLKVELYKDRDSFARWGKNFLRLLDTSGQEEDQFSDQVHTYISSSRTKRR